MDQTNSNPPLYLKYRYQLLLTAVFFVIYILPLGARPLVIPDETRYAEIPREMLSSGNWAVPHFNGMRYFEKPVLGYWIHAVSIRLLGENNFAVRLPSALAVGFSALLIFFLLYYTNRNRNSSDESYLSCPHNYSIKNPYQPSFLGSFIFLVSFEVFGIGNTAVLDNLLALFLTATLAFFFFASESTPNSNREKFYLILSGSCCGLAFMTKGFLAFAIPALTLSAYLIWERRFRDLWRMSWIPLLTAILISLPWAILIHIKEPDFWNFFFWNEHVRRFFSGNAQHEKTFFYYFLCAPGVIMPWTFVAPSAFLEIRKSYRESGIKGRLIRLALCWMILPFLLFSCASGKLLTYILPCFPPFAILTGFGFWSDTSTAKWRKFFRWGVLANAILFGLILLLFTGAQFCEIGNSLHYAHPWKTLLGINGLVTAIMLFCFSAQARKRTHKIILLGLAPGLLFLSAHFLVPDLVIEKKAPGPFLTHNQSCVTLDTIVIAEARLAGAVCWYLKRDNIYIIGHGGEFKYGLSYDKSSARRLDLKPMADFIRQHPGKIVLVARVKRLNQWRNVLPQPVSTTNNGEKGVAIWKF